MLPNSTSNFNNSVSDFNGSINWLICQELRQLTELRKAFQTSRKLYFKDAITEPAECVTNVTHLQK